MGAPTVSLSLLYTRTSRRIVDVPFPRRRSTTLHTSSIPRVRTHSSLLGRRTKEGKKKDLSSPDPPLRVGNGERTNEERQKRAKVEKNERKERTEASLSLISLSLSYFSLSMFLLRCHEFIQSVDKSGPQNISLLWSMQKKRVRTTKKISSRPRIS